MRDSSDDRRADRGRPLGSGPRIDLVSQAVSDARREDSSRTGRPYGCAV